MIDITSAITKTGTTEDTDNRTLVAPKPVPRKASGAINAVEDTYALGDIAEAFSDGARISPIGMKIAKAQQGTLSINPFKKYEFTDEEREKYLQKTNYDTDALDIACEGADNLSDVDKNLDLIYENRRLAEKAANSPWYMGLVSGAGQMVGNPVDIFVTALSFAQPQFGLPLKAATASRTATVLTKAGKAVVPLAANVAAGVGSNQLQEVTTGVDHDVWGDVLGITMLSLGIKGLKHTGDAARKVAVNHDKMIKGEEVDTSTVLGKFSDKTLPVYKKLNDVREQIESKLPSVEIKTRLMNYMKEAQNPKLKEFVASITDYEQGIRALGNKNFAGIDRKKQSIEQDRGVTTPQPTLAYGSGKTTLFEEVEGFKVEDNTLMDRISNRMSILSDHFGRDTVNDFLYKKISGRDTSSFGEAMNKNKDLAELADRIGKAYEKRGYQLVHHQLVDNIYSFGKYLPMIVDHNKVVDYVKRSGLSGEQARARLSTNLYNGVINDKETYDRFFQIWREERGKEPSLASLDQKKLSKTAKAKSERREEGDFLKWLAKESDNAAYGYTDQNTSRGENFTKDINRVNFQKRRLPWNSAYRDVYGFALDDLRMDLLEATRSYFSTTTGMLATKRVYNKDYEGIQDLIHSLAVERKELNNLDVKYQEELERDLKAVFNRAFGKATSDREYGTSDALSAIARNLTYGAYSTLMGVLSYGEVAQAIGAYSFKFLMQAMPGVREVYEKFLNKDLSKADRRNIQDYFVGREVYDLLRGKEIIRANQEMYRDVNPYLAKVVGLSQVFAEYSPGNLAMRYSNNSIIDAVQSCFWAELINKAYARKNDYRGFLRDIDLKRVDISKSDYEYMLRRLKEFTIVDENGMSLKSTFNQLTDDDRFTYAFRRLTDYVCNETLQRRGLDDLFIWQVGKGNPFLSLAMQFKTFAIQSYNKRFVKMMNRLEDEGGLAQLNNFMVNSALTAATTMVQVQLRSLGMPEEEREKYLRDNLGIATLEDLKNPENYVTLLFQSMYNRNPLLASLALITNSMGIGTSTKTTAATRSSESESGWVGAPSVENLIVDMTPAARLASALMSGGVGTYNLIRDTITDDDTYYEKKRTMKQIMFGLSGLPNIPLITPSLKQYAKEELEDYKYGY